MQEPDIKTKIGGYLLTWDNNLEVKVDRLYVHSDGRVTGELEITNSDKAAPLLLLPCTQFNFSSQPTRAKFTKQLKEKYPDADFNWTELFDYLAYKIQKLARAGEPVEEVEASENIVPLEYYIDPIIIKGQSNIIFGEKGVNKSSLAYLLGAILYLPWDDNPLELTPYSQPLKSLVLDWETDRTTFDYYLSRMMKGMQMPQFSLYYRHCRLPLAEELEEIERYINETQISLLIVDSLAAAAGGEAGELKGSQSALQFNSALRKLKLTSLILAQTSKEITRHKKSIYGSVIFTYYARNILELCRGEEDDSQEIHLGLFHRECNLVRKHPPIGIAVKYDDVDNSVAMRRESLSISEFMAKVTAQTKILNLLKSGALNTSQIVEQLEIKRNTCDQAIKRLKSKGKVVKVGEKWGLPKI